MDKPSNTPCCKCKFRKYEDCYYGYRLWCLKSKQEEHDPVNGTSVKYTELPEARGNNQECELFEPKLFTRIYRWFTNRIVVKQVEVTNEK